MNWAQIFDDEDYTVSTVPLTDVMHHTRLDCLCGPREEVYNGEDGVLYWNTIHHPLIGREKS